MKQIKFILGLFIVSVTFVCFSRTNTGSAAHIEEVKQEDVAPDSEQNTEDFVIEGKTLIKYQGHDTKVIIPKGVTSINYLAFEDQNIEEVIIPEGVTSIGEMAFYNCAFLKKIQFPQSLYYMESLAFAKNTSLVHLVLPENLEYVPDGAFADCTSLEDVQVPKELTEIGEYAFARCGKLIEINLSAVKRIGKGAFTDTALMQVDLSSLKWAGNEVFVGTDIDFGSMESLPEINIMEANPFWNSHYWKEYEKEETQNTFWIVDGVLLSGQNCSGKVEIPRTVTKIAAYAFTHNNKITSVAIPDTVTAIGRGAFSSCKRLKAAGMKDSVIELGKETFSLCLQLSEVRLSNQIKVLPKDLFCSCPKLTKLTLPERITRLEDSSLWLASLKTITLPLGEWEVGSWNIGLSDILYVTDINQIKQYPTLKKMARDCEIKELALTDTKLTLRVGEKYPLRFNSGAKAAWKSSRKSVATVGQTGNIYAKKPGTTVVTATIYGKEYTCVVKVVK